MANLLAVVAVWGLLAAASAGMMVGSFRDVDVNSQDVKDALSFALYQFNIRSNDMYASRLMEVTHARRQLVNGYNFEIEAKVGRTNCRKPTTNPSTCELHTEPNLSKTETCKFKVYSCPWKSEIKLNGVECN